MRRKSREQRDKVVRHLESIRFDVEEVVQMNTTAEFHALIHRMVLEYGIVQSLPKQRTANERMKLVCTRWCQENCHDGWTIMPNATAWGFENASEAIMFKLIFVTGQ